MSSTREKVLKTLLTRHRCTIKDLADAVGISPISVRHHINKLEADGLATSDTERHGVGRPRYVYYLTEKGMEQFPSRYLRLTIKLLQQLKETLPKPMMEKIFTQMGDDMALDYAAELELDDLSIEERLDIIKDVLETEGFTINWKLEDDVYYIQEASCPYHRVGESHPEVCFIGETLISNVLSMPIERTKSILEGDAYCTYTVSNAPKTESDP
ncbi:MAG: winged helix-turn-helix transcriptional regulator [Chloroflexota bacterium]|nr:winged helix-turn-helix transcriptional regulator [Chloroflexota bacterium]